jgi:Ca2+-transporting ATPase
VQPRRLSFNGRKRYADFANFAARAGGNYLGTSVASNVQEARSERVLESLRDLTSPRAVVIRDGIETRIAATEVVRGDLIVLAEGDRVTADARLVAAHDLMTDESLLTGESAPVRKTAAPREGAASRPSGDDLPYVYSGSLVLGLALCTIAVVLYGVLRGGWLDAVLSGIALGMSMLPEEFPLVLTVFMVMGAWRISHHKC